VNIASRLETLATPGEILISYENYAHVTDEIACEEKGEVEVKGLAYPVATYQVLGPRDAASPPLPSNKTDWETLIAKGPEAMTEAERREAITRLSDALEHLPGTAGKADAAE